MEDLKNIRDAMDENTGDGRDHPGAIALADECVAKYPDVFSSFKDMTLEQCVQAVDVFRAANMFDDQWRVETWLLHNFHPQVIGGGANVQVRIANG